MSADPTTPRALTGLAPRRSLGVDPGLSVLRRESRPTPAAARDDERMGGVEQPVSAGGPDGGEQAPPIEPQARRDDGGEVELAEAASRTRDTYAQRVDLPRYLQLTRKESRIRSDQADRLAEHVRRLNRVRTHRNGSVGERITDNTLIRVAIDLLLARADQLSGTTEEEIRHSVSQ